jgi:hypothetical protein
MRWVKRVESSGPGECRFPFNAIEIEEQSCG